MSSSIPSSVATYLADESLHPQLFGCFVFGGKSVILSNTSGNVEMGICNGTRCTMHSIAWSNEDVENEMLNVIHDAMEKGEAIVTVDCPPDYIIVELMDSSTGEIRDKIALHADFNLNDEKESKSIFFPISLSMEEATEVRTKDKKKIEVHFKQRACELAFCLTVWKAQGHTYDKVILHLEPSG